MSGRHLAVVAPHRYDPITVESLGFPVSADLLVSLRAQLKAHRDARLVMESHPVWPAKRADWEAREVDLMSRIAGLDAQLSAAIAASQASTTAAGRGAAETPEATR